MSWIGSTRTPEAGAGEIKVMICTYKLVFERSHCAREHGELLELLLRISYSLVSGHQGSQ